MKNFGRRIRTARLALGSLTAALTLLAASPVRAELADHLKTLQAVGDQGAGNQAATAAWKEVAESDASQLTTILAALDGANPIASNWICAAVDAIAERELAKTGKLPAGDLQNFVLATEHAPRARRLAFELLTSVDAKAPDRLVPGFLQDPSVEFRRDAVARLIDEGTALLAKEKKQEAANVFAKALEGARDLDQVQKLAEDLKKLGRPVDLPRHFGFLMNWKLIGPFDNTGEKAFDVAYPPETEIDLAAKYEGKDAQQVAWREFTTDDDLGTVDLNKAIGKLMGAVGYAATEFHSDAEQEVEFRLGSLCANKLWVNAELVGAHEIYHSGGPMDGYVARVKLRAGANQVLLKVCQNEQTQSWAQDWSFQIRVCDAAGTAILSTDRPATKPRAATKE